MKVARSTTIALAFAVAIVALPARAAQAQVVTYNTRSLFLAAVNTPTTVTFTGEQPGDLDIQYLNGGSTTTNGLTLSSPANNVLMVANPTGVYGADRGTGALEVLIPTSSSAAQLTFSFGAFEKAFAFDFGSYTGSTDVFSYTLSNGQTGTFRNNDTNALTFFGLTSSTVFNSVTLRVADEATAYDNVTYASGLSGQGVTATPEPATWVMMLSGLGVVGFMARRRRRDA